QAADPASVPGTLLSRSDHRFAAWRREPPLDGTGHRASLAPMTATRQLHEAGQSLWLDNITRGLVMGGGPRRRDPGLALTGLTSNPTIFDQAVSKTADYDDAIRARAAAGQRGEDLFLELAIEDLRAAADLFRPVYDATNAVDGFVSLELPPHLAFDTAGSVE